MASVVKYCARMLGFPSVENGRDALSMFQWNGSRPTNWTNSYTNTRPAVQNIEEPTAMASDRVRTSRTTAKYRTTQSAIVASPSIRSWVPYSASRTSAANSVAAMFAVRKASTGMCSHDRTKKPGPKRTNSAAITPAST